MRITATEEGITIDVEDGTPVRVFRVRNPNAVPMVSWTTAEPAWGIPLRDALQPRHYAVTVTADVEEVRDVDV